MVGRQHERMVTAAEMCGHPRRLAMLADGDVAFETDVEGVDRTTGQVGHQRRDEAGVDAAADERAERHVRDEHPLDRRAQLAVERILGLAVGQHQLVRIVGPPVGPDVERAAAQRKGMPRRQLAYAAEDRMRRRYELALEVQAQRRRIEFGRDRRMREHGLQLRAEHERRAVPRVVERLDAQVIAGGEERLRAGVPEREREHPAQVRDDVLAPLRPPGQYRLGVARRAERPAAARQFVAQLTEVVDFAVEDQRHAAVGAEHRLRTARDVDDRQATMAEVRASGLEEAVGVGTAMRERARHRRQHRGCERRIADVTGDAAHGNSVLRRCCAYRAKRTGGATGTYARDKACARREVYPKMRGAGLRRTGRTLYFRPAMRGDAHLLRNPPLPFVNRPAAAGPQRDTP